MTAQLARLPLAMTPLAFLLLATAATGNYRLGGVMIAAGTIAEVLIASPAGRLLDRGDPRRLASMMLLTGSLVLGLLTGAAELSWPGVLLVALAVVSSSLTAGVPAGMRRILQHTVPDRLMAPALAVDGVAIEFVVIAGPLLVAAVVPLAQVAGVGAMAAVTLGAAVLVRGLAPPRPAPRSPDGAPAASHQRLSSPSFVLWLGIGLAAAQTIGLAEVSALPIAHELGGGTPTAVLLQVVLAVASASTGLVYGARSNRLPGSPLQRAVTLLLGLSVGAVMLAVQAGSAVTAAGYVVVGACTAPLITTVLITIQDLVPAGRAAEAYGMNTASTGVGYALAGAALATLPLQREPLQLPHQYRGMRRRSRARTSPSRTALRSGPSSRRQYLPRHASMRDHSRTTSTARLRSRPRQPSPRSSTRKARDGHPQNRAPSAADADACGPDPSPGTVRHRGRDVQGRSR